MSQPTRTRGQFLRDLANPKHKTGGYVLPHISAFGAIVIFTVIFYGVFAIKAGVDWAQRIQHERAALHIKGGVVIPKTTAYIAPKTGGPTLPGSAGIYFRYFMGTTNQGGTLSCAAQGAAKTIAYQETKKFASASNAEARYYAHHKVKISPRQLYDLNTGGASVITSVSDYNAIAATNGTVSTTVLNYGPNQRPSWISAWGVEPVPSFARYGHRIATHASFLWYYPGAGYGAVQRAKEAIYGHRPVAIGSDWYYNAEKSSWTTGKMGLPVAGDWVEYGHTTVLVRYNDSIRMPDGTTGAFLASNSFGKLYGRNPYGNIQRGHGGYVWLSYAYVGRYAAYGTVEDLGPARTGGGTHNPKDRPAVNPHAPVHLPPFTPSPQTGGGAYSFWVHDVYTRDTNVNLTYDFNYWGKFYNVWPVGLVATALTESSLHQFAPRCCIPGDTSYGLAQFTLGTACAYGICYDIENRLNNPHTAVRIMAEYYANAARETCVPFPYLYAAFNQGTGYGCNSAAYYNPSGVAYSNFQGFLANYAYAQQVYMGGTGFVPPKPKPQLFPRAAWGKLSPYYCKSKGHCSLSWAASVWRGKNQWLGHALDYGVWHPTVLLYPSLRVLRPGGFTVTRFQEGRIYTWPHYHKAKVVRRRAVLK